MEGRSSSVFRQVFHHRPKATRHDRTCHARALPDTIHIEEDRVRLFEKSLGALYWVLLRLKEKGQRRALVRPPSRRAVRQVGPVQSPSVAVAF